MEGDDTASLDMPGWLRAQRSSSVERGPGQRGPVHSAILRGPPRVAACARQVARVESIVLTPDAGGQAP